MSGLDIEGVLGMHWFLPTTSPYGWCACKKSFKHAEHRAHVAAVLREQIATWLESEAASVRGRWPESSPAGTLHALAALVAPSRVPGEET